MNFAVVIQKNRKGRKRKSTKTISAEVPRYSNGKTKGNPAEIRATGLIQRLKLGAPLADAFDEKWGYTLGQMRLRGKAYENGGFVGQRDPSGIDQTQYETAQRYEEVVFKNRYVKGLPNPFPKSPAFNNWIRGQSLAAEMSQDDIDKALGRFRDARACLLRTGVDFGLGAQINWIVYEVVIMDRPIDIIKPEEFGNFKLGLNALARVV